ncbi:hypothetical protein Z043_109383 [Scleropages formosus]|uniref:SVIL n=1 Tax=Scleropages formosus TaxID=113540 RepID=A0A0P7V972_SCLFO|nr:hypothetical protein Z043_109383 [Scleropages formosus]
MPQRAGLSLLLRCHRELLLGSPVPFAEEKRGGTAEPVNGEEQTEECGTDPMEGLVLEPKAERIARYKAERRRQLAERYGLPEELPPKHVRRETGEVPEPNGDSSGSTLDVPEGNGCHQADSSPSDLPCPNASAGRAPGRLLSHSPASVHGGGHPSPDTATGPASGAPQLRTRVSVGQLKSALLQRTCGGTPAEKA